MTNTESIHDGASHGTAASEATGPAEPETIMAEALESGPRPVSRILRSRRKKLPALLFLITCLSTFFAGALSWLPDEYLSRWFWYNDGTSLRRVFLLHWQDGLIYMGCVLAILLAHEMGHFLAAMRYGVPASLPYFLPLPISPFGTLGAVIGMDGTRANRKQMFDIGLAGPLAGLLVIVPVLWLGMRNLDLSGPAHGLVWDTPLIVRWLLNDYQPPGYHGETYLGFSQVNAYFMAAWVGLFITALNMLPVSQLDGGHVLHALFGPRGRWISRGVVLLAVGYMAWALTPIWLLMVVLVLVIGVDHPPTRDDRVPLGWLRFGLGLISLLIPVLCLPPTVYKVLTNAEATTASAPLDPLGTVPGGGGRENRGVDIVKTTLPDRAGSLH